MSFKSKFTELAIEKMANHGCSNCGVDRKDKSYSHCEDHIFADIVTRSTPDQIRAMIERAFIAGNKSQCFEYEVTEDAVDYFMDAVKSGEI